MARVQFQQVGALDSFGHELIQGVNAYFETRGISQKATPAMVLKSAFYLVAYLTAYGLLVSNQFSAAEDFGLWALLGLLIPGIGFNIGHDALHGAYSEKRGVNAFVSESFSLIGADTRIWKILHNTIHHSYTNIWGADGDLKPVPLLRFHSKADHRPWHLLQHFYAPFLYCLTSLAWVFRKDFEHTYKKQHLIYKYPLPTRGDIRKLFLVKGLYFSAFLVIPLIVLSQPWWEILLGFLLMHFVAGFFLAIVFQLGHIVEGPDFETLESGGLMKGSWMAHQLTTSSNFSQNAIGLWLFGGLNYQIEHHLFPRICHSHYPALAPIVRRIAAKYGLKYNEQPGFWAAVRSHFRVLKKLSRTRDLPEGPQ